MAHSMCEFKADGMPQAAAQLLTELHLQQEEMIVSFFSEEMEKGTLKSQSSPRAVALFLMSINAGIAAMTRVGISHDELDEMIEHAVQTFV